MNLYKITGPDTTLGKALIAGRAAWQLSTLRWRGDVDPDFARLARSLVPGHTMVSLHRLKKLYELGAEIEQRGISGAIAECGVWNGGSSAMIAAGAARVRKHTAKRSFWLFDSFEGLPEPTENDEARVRTAYFTGWCTGSVDKVREAHKIADHDLKQLTIVPGWFEDTLPRHAEAIGSIALLHIDADWYDSVMVVLTTLYDRVVPGGVVVIDDYGSWSGCRKAVHAYFGEAGVTDLDLQTIDGCAVFFRKP